MKIFSWIRNRSNGIKQGIANNPINTQPISYHNMGHQPSEEELFNWPNGLLAIGTFGNNNLKQSEKLNQDHSEISTVEDQVEQVDSRELRLLLSDHIGLDLKEHDLSVEELLDCLVGDEKETNKERGHLQRESSVVQRERKDIRYDNRKRGIGKKSLSYLIKKAFLCRGGFMTPPTLRDPLPDPKLDHPKMEKILRAMLNKKIYPGPQSQRLSPKTKYLHMGEAGDEEEANHESKWVKTDSECGKDAAGGHHGI